MKKIILPLGACALLILAGCLAVPVADSGGIGSVTVTNTNLTAIVAAAQAVFADYGYSAGPSNFPASISFEKPAGSFGKLMWGGYAETTTIRVWLKMVPVPGTNNYVLNPRVSRVSDAGQAGFEDSAHMSSLWSGQFGPLLQKIRKKASGAGPM